MRLASAYLALDRHLVDNYDVGDLVDRDELRQIARANVPTQRDASKAVQDAVRFWERVGVARRVQTGCVVVCEGITKLRNWDEVPQ
jgi:hypothetical protein